MMPPVGSEAVARVNRVIWLAALAAGSLAFGLSWLLVRTINAPLATVERAAQQVARGDLSARVPVAGPVEIQSVASAFNQMAEGLHQQEQLRRALLADVAHELRTPLTVMQGQLEALEDGVFPLTLEQLAPLQAQTAHLTRVVEDLRTLAHAEAGQLHLDCGPVSLALLVQTAFQMLAAHAATKGVTLTSEVPDTLPPLQADPLRLQQVLVNLLSNAVRHTPTGGAVVIRAQTDGDRATIMVLDTGEGIAPDALPHVFDRFYRVERSRSRSTGGSGLGLAITRRLVEAHDGTIALASEVGRGTMVSLTWPLTG
jgi:signal transduction histidine kinase